MQTLTVGLSERSYPIHIGTGLLANAELLAAHLPARRVAIVTNTTVAPLYLERLQQTLREIGVQSVEIILPDVRSIKQPIRSIQFMTRC